MTLAAPAPAESAPRLPLQGIRVVEFTHMVMGPTCGLVLADLGADVVKVEPAPAGDNTRRLTGSGVGFFAALNRNKRSLAVDLKSADGISLVRRLLAEADVLIENFRPGALDRLGLSYSALAAENPRLIYCSCKGFLPGPYDHRTALDEVVQMMGGLAYMTGLPGKPMRAGSSVNDIMGGMFGTIGILAAVEERHRTGRGAHVQTGLFENNVLLMAQHMAQIAITGKEPLPMGVRHPAWPIYDIFDTADGGQLFIGVVTETQWKLFCAAFDLPALAGDRALSTQAERVAGRERFLPIVAEAFRRYDRMSLMAKCEGLGLPYAPIARPAELFDDPHLNGSGGLLPVTLPDGRATRLPALPLALDGVRMGLRHDLPAPGEHGADIARTLGYTDADIARLREAGALGLMDLYHAWCDLKPGVRDGEFSDRVAAYLGHLQQQGLIASWRLTRRKLGLGAPGLGEFHLLIETRDLAQLDAAFAHVAARDEPVESFHFGVNAMVQNVRFALYRDFPDPMRKRGEERF